MWLHRGIMDRIDTDRIDEHIAMDICSQPNAMGLTWNQIVALVKFMRERGYLPQGKRNDPTTL